MSVNQESKHGLAVALGVPYRKASRHEKGYRM